MRYAIRPVASLVLAGALVAFGASGAVSAAPPKAGDRCPKVGAVAKDAQGRSLVCVKSKGGKLTWRVGKNPAPPPSPSPAGVPYQWSGSWERGWQRVGTPPPCPSNLSSVFAYLPFDATDVTSIRRPGYSNPQSGYKPHGHVRFSPTDADGVQRIVAPADGWLYAIGRYQEAYTPGNDQVILDFFTDCGVMWRFDHLRDGTLAPALQTAVDRIALREDSRTTRVTPVRVKAGDLIATAVGATDCEVGRPLCIPPGGPNYFVDFGVYDPRQLNAAALANPAYLRDAPMESLKGIAVCWLDLFPGSRSALNRLAEGDSDYCTVP